MKCLSICQPYSHLIVTPQAQLPPGVTQKRVENRNWSTGYRGKLLIHAGKSLAWCELDSAKARDELYNLAVADMTFGAIVGVVDLIDCVPIAVAESLSCPERLRWMRDHPHTSGPYCLVLANAVKFATPIPYRGLQMIFNVPDEIVQPAIARAAA